VRTIIPGYGVSPVGIIISWATASHRSQLALVRRRNLHGYLVFATFLTRSLGQYIMAHSSFRGLNAHSSPGYRTDSSCRLWELSKFTDLVSLQKPHGSEFISAFRTYIAYSCSRRPPADGVFKANSFSHNAVYWNSTRTPRGNRTDHR
jgi:hypothetical protein